MNDDDRQEGIFDAPAKHAEQPAKECGCGYPPHVGRCQPNTGDEPGESTITSLAVIETTSAALVYAPGALTALVDRLKQEVRAQLATLDVSIPKDKARIISLSARVATAKERLDEMGATLTEEHRAVVNAVNADRKIMRDDLAAFKVEVRKPVTDLENAEKERVAAHEQELQEIANAGPYTLTNWSVLSVEAMRDRLREIETGPRDWQEFATRAAQTKAYAKAQILQAIEAKEAHEAAQIELDRLRAEAVERAIKEREEAAAKAAQEAAERRAAEQARIAREAAEREHQRIENERIEAEARAKQAEAERIAAEERAARELAEAEHRAEVARIEAEDRERRAIAQERQRLADQQAEAERAAAAAEARRVAEAQAAQRRAQEAAAQAQRDQEAAIERERQRVAEEQRKELEEAEKRAKNRAHRLKIDNESLGAIVALDIPMDRAQDLLAAIAKGAVPHITISY
jgi:hypothetical protein